MNASTIRAICRLLIISITLLSGQAAQAGLIGVDQAVAAASAQSDRQAVLNTLGRSEVSSQLQSLGLDPQTAKVRVAAMTDEEVHSLAGKLESLPAGASGDWGWGLAAVIVIAAVIYWVYGYKR